MGSAHEISTIDHYTMYVLIIAARVEQLFQRRARNAARIIATNSTPLMLYRYTCAIHEKIYQWIYKFRKKLVIFSRLILLPQVL